MTSHTTSAYDCTANGSGLAANGTALKSVSNGSGGHPNYGATVIDSRAVDYLLMKLRSKNTKGKEFMVYGDRLMRILAEEALCRLPSVVEGKVETPCGTAHGLVDDQGKERKICLVSVVRSGDILQEAVRQLEPGVKVGKILIQRDEDCPNKTPKLFYKKLPKDISECFVILVDPMLATSGSARMALDVLVADQVDPNNIMFLNLICAPEGLKKLQQDYPQVHVVTGAIDSHLNEHAYIVPGLGDYGDRYYGTE